MSEENIPMKVKWGKETISIDLVPTKGVGFLKATLEEETGVPVDRMKLMPKSKGLWKGLLKDDFDLTSINYSKVKQRPIQALMMGSATKLAAPKTKTIFVEDLPPEEAAKVAPEPSGLVNLGNTCYLNSVVQCLRAVPALRSGLSNYIPGQNAPPAGSLAASLNAGGDRTNNSMFISSLRDLYGNLDRTAKAVPPSHFVLATKLSFPQFAKTGPQGQPMQQDAEEFYSGLLTIAASETNGVSCIQAGLGASVGEKDLMGASNLVDAVFGMKMEETLTCDETVQPAPSSSEGDAMEVDTKTSEEEAAVAVASGIEPPVKSYDLHRKLVCNIQGGSDGSSQVNVNHISEGIELSLSGKIEKRSDVLGRDAIWTRRQRIARLPPIIVVQFGRFYWKQTPNSQDHAGVKCKVMKPVAFNGTLDVYDFCTDKVKTVLKVSRDKALAEEEDRIAKKLKGEKDGEEDGEKKQEATAMETEGDSTTEAEQKAVENEKEGVQEDDDELKAALALSLQEHDATGDENASKTPLEPVGPGLPMNFQGHYELFGVVTHKGRDADGGHYMGWVKAETQSSPISEGKGKKTKISDSDEDNEDWFVFDDDEVSPCKTEDVLKLKGGGDWHMSYLNFYRAKK